MSTEVSLQGSGLVFDNTYVGLSSIEIEAAVDAENYFQSKFSNSVVMNLTFDLGSVGGAASNSSMGEYVSYSSLRSALVSHATTAEAITAASTLPTTPPSDTFALTQAMADILGLGNAPVVGTVTLNNTPGVVPLTNLSVLTGLFEHEISEQMGRISGLGDENGIWGPMDLFRYNAAGDHDYTDGRDGEPTYLSLDGGKTVLTDYVFTNNYVNATMRVDNATGPYDDPDDWSSAPTVGGLGDAFGAENLAGMAVSSTDLSIMNALGWNSSGSTPAVTSDILWHADNGLTATSIIQNTAQTAWQNDGVISSAFQPVATGDFNGDGNRDILWRDGNGNTVIADTLDGQLISADSLGFYPMAFTAIGSGDFDGGGTSDILWHAANGDTAISTIRNSQQTAWTDLGLYPTVFQAAGIGDFNGDGTSDILWRAGNGDTAISTIQDNAQIRWTDLGIVPMAFQVAGVGDFNGDGTSDILWHASNGETAISTILNDAQVKWTDLGIVPPAFQVAQIGDFNGDGTSDILWRAGNGDTAISTMQNGTQTKWTDLGVVPAFFHVVSN